MEQSAQRGRPRDASLDQAILDATRDILVKEGWQAVSMARVAREAGVGKATVYRRWGSKAELVMAATLEPMSVLEEGDDLAGLLRLLIDATTREFARPDTRAALPGFIAEMLADPTEINRVRIDPEIQAVTDAMARDRKAGIRNATIEPSLVYDLLLGAAFVRTVRGAPLTGDFSRRLHSALMSALEA